MNAAQQLCNAIYSAFTGNSPLVAAIPGGLSRDRAPEGTAMPYMVYTIISAPNEALYVGKNRGTFDVQFTLIGQGHDTQGTNMDTFIGVFDETQFTLGAGVNFFQQRMDGPRSEMAASPESGDKSATMADVWQWMTMIRYSIQ